MPYLGEIASLLTALCWSASSVFFALAGRRVGSKTVNISRLWMALGVLLLLHVILFRSLFPVNAGRGPLSWLGASGLIGFALGDAVLFESLVLLGPRLAMLIMTIWPVLGAILGWAFLNQHIGVAKVAAIIVTVAGVIWVVADRSRDIDSDPPKHLVLGTLLALGGAVGQSVGILCSKFGMAGGLHPISGNLIRVTAGTMALTVWHGSASDLGEIFARLKDRTALTQILAGALAGPVTGVILSLVAINHSSLGVTATLMSLVPVILLPVSAVVYRERITVSASVGTLVAIAGAAGLFIL